MLQAMFRLVKNVAVLAFFAGLFLGVCIGGLL